MPHWKSMMDRDFIFAFDLAGKDVTVTIREVKAGSLTSNGGRKAKKPVAYFKDKEKGLALNATNCKVIAKLYGNDTDAWSGKAITLYPTTTEMNGETVECIRVRPTVPRAAAGRNGKRDEAPPAGAEPDQAEQEEIRRGEAQPS